MGPDPVPEAHVYSGVVSLRSIRLICFIAELNSLDLHQGDISNACQDKSLRIDRMSTLPLVLYVPWFVDKFRTKGSGNQR